MQVAKKIKVKKDKRFKGTIGHFTALIVVHIVIPAMFCYFLVEATRFTFYASILSF